MADYLLVIDMQLDYVTDGEPYNGRNLVQTVNQKIASYPKKQVIYVINRFWWELGKKPKVFADGLSIVSNQIFEKRRASCFSNQQLRSFLENNEANCLEIIGVDGNACVNKSVLEALNYGYQVSVDLLCLGVSNRKKFQKTLKNWRRHRVLVRGENYR